MFVDPRIKERLDYPLTFERLDSLMMRTHRPNEIPVNLILNNTGIETLAWTGSFNSTDFFDILDQTKATHRIKNLKIKWQNAMNHKMPLKLVTEYNSLERIIFHVDERSGDLESFLRFISLVRNPWHVTDSWREYDDFHTGLGIIVFIIVIERKSIESDEIIEPYEITFERRVPKQTYMAECKRT